VDEVVAYTIGQGTKMQRYYPHYNHLYSVAALTGDKLPNGNVPIVERYSYNAYGKQTITSATGAVRAKSAVGWDRGFTGYVADNETGLLHARARQYSPTLGRFVGRDALKYVDGYSLYAAYYVPNTTDPEGTLAFCDPVDSKVQGVSWEIDQDNGAVSTSATPPAGLCRRGSAARRTSIANAIAKAKEAYDDFECPACCTKKSAYTVQVTSSSCTVDSINAVMGYLHLPVWLSDVRLTFRCEWTI